MRIGGPRSLIGQFVLLHALVALVAAATLPFGVAVLLHRVAHHYQREVLKRQAEAIAVLLPLRDPVRAVASVDVIAGGVTLDVVDAGRHVLAERGPARPTMIAAVPLAARPRIVRRGPLAAVSWPAQGRRWVVVSQDDAAPEVVTDDIVRTFLKRFALLLLPLTLLIPLAGYGLTRRLTRRMQAAADIAAVIGPRTLDRRLPRDTLPAEVEPLAVATNAALDRLEQSFAAQAAFAADVAHELRTPLAVIRLRLDAVGDPDARRALRAEVDRAARVIEQLLGLADLERPMEDARAPVDLGALAEEVVAERAPAVLAHGHRIALDAAAPTPMTGFAGAIVLALENLIDNALRHTPPGTRIAVTIGPGAQLSVADDGPRIAAADLARMAERFWRGGTAAEGSGLGLSIVARVAQAHGGTLRLEAGPGGRGLSARLTLAPTGTKPLDGAAGTQR